jgi:hypothetical protein
MNDRKKTGPKSDIMTVREVAGYLNCHYSITYRLLGNGAIPTAWSKDWARIVAAGPQIQSFGLMLWFVLALILNPGRVVACDGKYKGGLRPSPEELTCLQRFKSDPSRR